METNLVQLIPAILCNDDEIRSQAETKLQEYMVQDVASFILACSQELYQTNIPEDTRSAAGLAIVLALNSGVKL